MSDLIPEIKWVKRDDIKHAILWDDSVMLIAVRVENKFNGTWNWDIDKISVCADEDYVSLHHYNGEPYDNWSWEDVNYFAMVDGTEPSPE